MTTRRTFLSMALPALLVAGTSISIADPVHADVELPRARSQAVRITGGRLLMPSVVSGPVIDLTIRNDDRIARELAVAHVVPGTTLSQVLAAAGADEEASFFLDDPGGVFFLGPGEQVRYQRRLRPGTYVFHAVHGDGSTDSAVDYQIVRVTGDGRRSLPGADRVIGLADDGVTVPPLDAGAHRYAITNTGTMPHEVFIVGVSDPADLDRADEIGAWLEGGQIGPPPVPVHFPGSHQTIDPGITVMLTLTLRRGITYAFVDFQTGATAVATVC